MIAGDVAQPYEMLTALGVSMWVDGGWCVGALLGEGRLGLMREIRDGAAARV